MGWMVAMMLLAGAQDVPPLAGSLPPMPSRRGESDEPRRPRGPLFLSPMGEPFRGPDPVRQWFDGADTNKDGSLSLTEFVADAERFFLVLDRGKDGEIDPDDIEYYETVLAPEIRTGGEGAGAMPGGGMREGGGRGGRSGSGGGRRGGGGGSPGGGYGGGGGGGPSGGGASTQRYSDVRRGAARFSFFDYPEPVTAADTNFNRGVDSREFRDAAIDRFQLLDKNHDGKLTWSELPALAASPAGQFGGRGGRRKPPSGGDTPPPADDER